MGERNSTSSYFYRGPCPLCSTGEVRFTTEAVIDPEAAMRQAKRIIAECAKDAGLFPADLFGPSRHLRAVEARHFAEWRMRHELDMSLKSIGKVINRDHSSVIHGIRKAEERMASL